MNFEKVQSVASRISLCIAEDSFAYENKEYRAVNSQ